MPSTLSFLKAMKVGIWFKDQTDDHKPTRRDTYSSDANVFGDLTSRIDVNLVKPDSFELVGKFFEDRADDLAWATPSCPKVEDGNLILRDLSTSPSSISLGSQRWRIT